MAGYENLYSQLVEGTVNKVSLQTFAKNLALLHNASVSLPQEDRAKLKQFL